MKNVDNKKRLYVFHDQLVDSDDGAAIHYICTMAKRHNLDVVLVSGSNHEVDAQQSVDSLKLDQMQRENGVKGLDFMMPETITVDDAFDLDFTDAFVLQISPLDFDAIGPGWTNALALITQGGPDRGFNMRGAASEQFKYEMDAAGKYYPVESVYCIDKLNGHLLNTLSSEMKKLSLVNAFVKMIGRAPAKYAGARFNPLGLINASCNGTGANWTSFCGLCDLMDIVPEEIGLSAENQRSAERYVEEVEGVLASKGIVWNCSEKERELVVERLTQMNAVFEQYFDADELIQDFVCSVRSIEDKNMEDGFRRFVGFIDQTIKKNPSLPLDLLTPQYDLRAAVCALQLIQEASAQPEAHSVCGSPCSRFFSQHIPSTIVTGVSQALGNDTVDEDADAVLGFHDVKTFTAADMGQFLHDQYASVTTPRCSRFFSQHSLAAIITGVSLAVGLVYYTMNQYGLDNQCDTHGCRL